MMDWKKKLLRLASVEMRGYWLVIAFAAFLLMVVSQVAGNWMQGARSLVGNLAFLVMIVSVLVWLSLSTKGKSDSAAKN